MAISYGAKLFEYEASAITTVRSLGAGVKAGSLVCLAITGKRSGAYLNVSSISDTQGNSWEWRSFQSQFRSAIVAWTRTGAAMGTSDAITVRFNGAPAYSWVSAHSFEGASGTALSKQTANDTSATASVSVGVSGSDWLVFGVVMLPNATSGGLTPLNSGISRDDNGHSGSTPWAECFSRNGSGSGSYGFGAALPAAQQWSVCAVSFPFLAMPASPARAVPGLLGI